MAKYDVFISCKSEDYKYAEDIYEFLTNNGINTFLASKELRKVGESEYRRAISKAMKDAYHLIIFASDADYIESEWVFYEWDMFVNAKLKGFKPGNIVTILKDVNTDDIPMDLWKYESMSFDSYKETILNYAETEESKTRLKEIEEQRKKEEELRRAEEEKKRREEQQRKELVLLAEDYKKKEANLSIDVAKIRSTLKSLDIINKKCPVCGDCSAIDDAYCSKCGWIYSPLEGIPNVNYLLNYDHKALAKHRDIFNGYHASYEVEKTIKELESEKKNLRNQLDLSRREIIDLKERNKDFGPRYDKLQKENSEKDAQINKLKQELESEKSNFKNQFNLEYKNLIDLNEDIVIRYGKLKKENSEKDAQINRLKQELEKVKSKTSASSSIPVSLTSTKVSSKSSAHTSSRSFNGPYEVWVTFCPSAAESIIQEYDNTFSLYKNGNYVDNSIQKCVAAFRNLDDAKDLQNRLEYKGATVQIKRNGNVIN